MNRVWDDLMESAKTLADKAGKATDKAVEYSKMKYQSMQLSSDLRGLYEKLGNAVYTMVKSDFDNKELMDSIIAEIDDVKNRLEELNVKMAEQRNAIICPACGAISDKDACYCSRCGNKFVKKEECCCTENPEEHTDSAEEETAPSADENQTSKGTPNE